MGWGGRIGGMPAPLTFWDIAAGILIGGGLIMGMCWGARRSGNDRAFFWICAGLAAFVIGWRTLIWHGDIPGEHRQSVADLYAEYGIVPSDHQ